MNQTYDEQKAKEDKKNMREAACWLREAGALVLGVLGGWALLLARLRAIRESSPEAWVTSEIKVNLHPFHLAPFDSFCKRIAGFLQSGQNFKP